MEKLVEQTLSKPTVQFGLRLVDYLVLVLVATVGSFFIARFWLLLILLALGITFYMVNKTKHRYFWSSLYLWITRSKNIHLKQTQKLPPLFR